MNSNLVGHPNPGAGTPARIEYLDGLRGIAILTVMGFHYYSGGTTLYPYGAVWADFPLFHYGGCGVELFFAISGWVIALSLERCDSGAEFFVKRFARLWPSMLLCSAITYAVLGLWPKFWPQSVGNFLPSLTFVDGNIWNALMPDLRVHFIDNVYWTLFVEVRFYAIAAALYFLCRRRLATMFSTFSTLSLLAHAALKLTGHPDAAGVLEMTFVVDYLPWFMLGIAALQDRRGDSREAFRIVLLAGLLLGLRLLVGGQPRLFAVVFLVVTALLFAPARLAFFARWLAHPALAGIGVASYSLYLLHQRAGLTLISVLAEQLGLEGPASLGVSALVGAAFIAGASVIFRFWETPMNRWIVRACGYARAGPPEGARHPAASSVNIVPGPALVGSPALDRGGA